MGGGIANFLCGGYGSFLEQPITQIMNAYECNGKNIFLRRNLCDSKIDIFI